MRIFLSAYACEPGRGSEPGIGWNWCLELAKQGHKVFVLTRRNNQEAIEAFFKRHQPLQRPVFFYYDLPGAVLLLKRRGILPVQLYYLLWQICCVGTVRDALHEHQVDCIWHLTFGVLRQPSFLWRLRKPFIFGPVGGGESAPLRMRNDYSLSGQIADYLRDGLNWLSKWDPMVQVTLSRAHIIFAKTRQSVRFVPKRWREKTQVYLELGINELTFPRERDGESCRFLFVGRFLYWKGLTIAIRAFAHYIQLGGTGRFTVIGRGPEEARARALARTLGAEPLMDWKSWVDQKELALQYQEHDVFLFPSLHDSSGNVVVEALSYGLPVVCLKLGGPGEIVTDQCGVAVDVHALSLYAVVAELGRQIKRLDQDRKALTALSNGALVRARDFLWETRVSGAIDRVQMALVSHPLQPSE